MRPIRARDIGSPWVTAAGSTGTDSVAPRTMVWYWSTTSGSQSLHSPSGHWTRTSARGRVAQADVDRAQLAADVPAAHGELPPLDLVAGPDLDPGADGVPVGTRLLRASMPAQWPMSFARLAGAGAHVAPGQDRRATRDLDQVEQPVEVEVDERSAATQLVAQDAGLLRALDEGAVGGAQQQVAGVLLGVVLGTPPMLPLDTNRSMRPSLLTSANSGCQAVDGQGSPPANGCAAPTPAARLMFVEGRPTRAVGKRLELVVGLVGEVVLGVAVAGHVVARDAHAVELDAGPAVRLRVQRRRLARPRSATAGPARRGSSAGRW